MKAKSFLALIVALFMLATIIVPALAADEGAENDLQTVSDICNESNTEPDDEPDSGDLQDDCIDEPSEDPIEDPIDEPIEDTIDEPSDCEEGCEDCCDEKEGIAPAISIVGTSLEIDVCDLCNGEGCAECEELTDNRVLYRVWYDYFAGNGRTLGYPGLNEGGNFFPMAVYKFDPNNPGNVTNKLRSYCAYGGSVAFAGDEQYNPLGCKGYYIDTSNSAIEAKFRQAFEYIECVYGDSVDPFRRVITQTVVWALRDCIDINSSNFANSTLNDEERAAVIDIMSNYQAHTGNGNVIGVLYLICEAHKSASEWKYCQPQIVPLYGPSGGDCAGCNNGEEPIDPLDDEDDEDPVDPTDPVDPVDPTDPEEPTELEEPTDPEESTDPEEPTEPETPTDPPNSPDTSDTDPGETDNGDSPDTPDNDTDPVEQPIDPTLNDPTISVEPAAQAETTWSDSYDSYFETGVFEAPNASGNNIGGSDSLPPTRRTIVADPPGWIELDDEGTPLGRWDWCDVEETWIFDEFDDAVPLSHMPLSQMPQTGIGNMSALFIAGLCLSFAGSLVSSVAIRFTKIRTGLNKKR